MPTDRLDDILWRRKHIVKRYMAALADHPFVSRPSNWQIFQV
jgi:hypothetical protein